MDQLEVAIIGAGYIGTALANAFSKYHRVIVYDFNVKRIEELQDQKDIYHELSEGALENIHLTSDSIDIKNADVYLITVQSPIKDFKSQEPKFYFLESASELIGGFLQKGNAVVLESTVFPGFTGTLLKGWLEKASGLHAGKDFYLGYSPERVNPGDPEHQIQNVTKIVAGHDDASLSFMEDFYQPALLEKVYKAPSMKVAEAAKMLENMQRDTNIALMNDVAMAFHRMGINTKDVLDAAKTKWNFLPFKPGFVGGHCIRIDPYYFIYEAKQYAASPKFIQLARDVNESMLEYTFHLINKEALKFGEQLACKVALLGISFKPDCSDFRESLLVELYRELAEKYEHFLCIDPVIDDHLLKIKEDITLDSLDDAAEIDLLILGQSHQVFIDMGLEKLKGLLSKQGMIIDLAQCFNKKDYDAVGIKFWQL